MSVETRLDIEACSSLSWTMKLARILLVESYKICWYLVTSSKVVLENIQDSISIYRVYKMIAQSRHCLDKR